MKTTEEDVCLPQDHLESREGPPLATQRRSFRCMGTSVTLIAPLPGSRQVRTRFEEAFEIVRRTFVREDERFSRFRNDVCWYDRARSDVPILIVTAKDEPIDRVVGLELGADDYVVKPFSSRELAARIRAVLRRSAVGEPAGQIEIGDVWIDPAMREASVRGVRLQLPAREFDLLCLLMQNAGRVVRREDIMDELWGGDWFGSTKTLDVHVGRLRRRIGAGTGVDGHITTIRRVGFRFATENDLALSPRRPPAVAAKQPRTG
jgi:two-component system response regulator RegX3